MKPNSLSGKRSAPRRQLFFDKHIRKIHRGWLVIKKKKKMLAQSKITLRKNETNFWPLCHVKRRLTFIFKRKSRSQWSRTLDTGIPPVTALRSAAPHRGCGSSHSEGRADPPPGGWAQLTHAESCCHRTREIWGMPTRVFKMFLLLKCHIRNHLEAYCNSQV